MALRSTNDIPEEVKSIIEIFYLQGETAARKEAETVRQQKPELASIIDDVIQLFPTAPESVFMFYDMLIAAASVSDDIIDDDFSFKMDDILGDPSAEATPSPFKFDMPENKNSMPDMFLGPDDEDPNGDSFAQLLDESLNSPAPEPDFFAASAKAHQVPKESLSNPEGQLSSPFPNSNDINLDIDVDFNLFDSSGGFSKPPAGHSGLDITNNAHVQLKNGTPFDNNLQRDGATPLPNNIQTAQIDKLQEKIRSVDAPMPSIMRAMQKSQLHEEQIQARRVNDLLHSTSSTTEPGLSPAASSMDYSEQRTIPHTPGIEGRGFGNSADLGDRCIPSSRNTPYSAVETGQPTTAAIASINVPDRRNDSRIEGLIALNQIQPVSRTPRLLCKMSELSKKQGINAKLGFILSMIDGVTSIADILDISAWSEGETAKLLIELQNMGIIDFY